MDRGEVKKSGRILPLLLLVSRRVFTDIIFLSKGENNFLTLIFLRAARKEVIPFKGFFLKARWNFGVE